MKKNLLLVAPIALALGACSVTVTNLDMNGVEGRLVQVPATLTTPGMTAVVVPNGINNGANVAAVGGNGYVGDLLGSGAIIGHALIGGDVTAIADATAVAVAENH